MTENIRNAEYWIQKLNLAKHPEGGYFKETYCSHEKIPAGALPGRYSGPRPFSTSIYYLLRGEQVSRIHRLKSDEIWHFYTGSALIIHIFGESSKCSTIKLGSDFEEGEVFQTVVEKGCWFGACVSDQSSYSLVGCTVSPGFHFDDFELGKREELIQAYPEHGSIIQRLTR